MMYYIMYNGQQIGPVPADQLRNYGLNPQSMVWTEGMPNWVTAGSVPELAQFLAGPQQPPFGQNFSQPGYGGATMPLGNRGMQPMMQINNYFALAVVSTVLSLFSCIGAIFGIIAIVKANKVNPYIALGQYELAQDSAKNAKTFSIIALVFAGLGLLGTIWLYSGIL